MNHKWNYQPITPEQAETSQTLAQELGISPILGQLLVQRGITKAADAKKFFRPQLPDLHDPFLMKDMDIAVERLNRAMGKKERILIYGDYDVDGTTAVALVYKFIQQFYSNLDYYIPDRYNEGYGISKKGVDYAAETGVGLIIVLDCGIKAVEEITYAKEKGMEICRQKYGKFVCDILDYIVKGGHPNLFLHDNGLLYSNGKERVISWMNAVVDGRPVNPRSGYLVEFNGLWYNGLKFAAALFAEDKEMASKVEQWNAIADKTAESFVHTFLNDYGYLVDYVDGAMSDWSVRPNMLIALSLDYSPLDKRQRKRALEVVTRELLTPKGIRTLSPKSYGYNPTYVGSQTEREYAYHQGPARPWLMGAYADAYLKIFGISGVSFLERMLIGFEDEMSQTCIGSISELFDGNPPFAGRGAISYAANVGEILRVLNLLKKYNM